MVEDTATTIDEIRHQFGDLVADTVAGCSEEKNDASGTPRPWEDRKGDHLVALRSATEAVKAVVLADKLHNLMSIRIDLDAGRPVWDSFHASRDRVLWYHEAVITCCESPNRPLQALAEACREELRRVVSRSEKNWILSVRCLESGLRPPYI